MHADDSELVLNLAAEVAVRHEPHHPADVARVGELQEDRPGEKSLPGTRRGSQGSESATAQNRQSARRAFILPLPGSKIGKGQDGRPLMAVGADGHSVVYMGRAATDPRDDVMNVEHVGKTALADTADVMLPGGDSSAFGWGEQPTRIPAAASQRDPRESTRSVSSLCCFVGAPIASISGARSVLPTPP
jgi:hypothetical protein